MPATMSGSGGMGREGLIGFWRRRSARARARFVFYPMLVALVAPCLIPSCGRTGPGFAPHGRASLDRRALDGKVVRT